MSFIASTAGCDMGVWKVDSSFKWWCQEHPELQEEQRFYDAIKCLQAALFHSYIIHHSRTVVDLDAETVRQLLHGLDGVSLAHRHQSR